jgi:hypothetical protein
MRDTHWEEAKMIEGKIIRGMPSKSVQAFMPLLAELRKTARVRRML